jgi:repressor LexA
VVLRTIDRLTRELGFPPTFRELGEAMRIASSNGVSDHLRALERHGWLTRTERTARAVLLTRSGSAWLATARAA